MSDYTKQSDGEQLFDENEIVDTETTEDQADDENSESHAESSQDDIEAKANKAEVERQKQIATWQARIDSGEYTIDELPSNLSWIKKHLKGDTAQEVKRILQEEKEREEYQNTLSMVKETNLTSEQKRQLQEDFSEFLEDGMSKIKALKAAIKANNISFDTETKRAAMRLPSQGVERSYDNTDGEAKIAAARAKYGRGHPKVIEAIRIYSK